ncbi:MAG: phosphoglucomutase, partial [Candidatus Thermoplasmatota archaeon]
GSHMPYDRIGIIFLESNGTYASFALSTKIEKIYFEKKYKVKIPIEKIGKIYVSNDAVEIYKKKILQIMNIKKIKKMNFKILADPCNGTASKILPCILKKFGCDVIEVNCLQKNKPDREPEPRAHSLRKTAKLVKKFGCDLGVATDIDADRVVFIDSNGNVIMEDLIGVMFASRIFKKKKGTLVLPVNSSLLIESLAKKHGWKIVYCRIGQPNTMASFKKYNADYAYEESGKYYFVENGQIWCDGILTTLKILELLSNEDTTLDSIIKEFPKIYQKKVKIRCREEEKEKIMKNLHKHLTDFNLKKEIRIDGLKRIYKDNSWVIIRPSGTELYIRIFAESREKRRAEELVEAGRKAVYSARCH